MNKVPSSSDPALPGQDNPTPESTAAVAATVGDILNCGAAATTRIEIYVPGEGGEHHVLDSVAYYCDIHADGILEVISWDADDSVRVERTALTDQDKACGDGWDSTALDRKRSDAAAVLGDDHPIVNTAVEALRAFGDDLSREDAARLLEMWQHGKELSDRERAAILAHFPGTAVSAETLDLLRRLESRLRDVDDRERRAFAKGYAQGVAARLTGTADERRPS